MSTSIAQGQPWSLIAMNAVRPQSSSTPLLPRTVVRCLENSAVTIERQRHHVTLRHGLLEAPESIRGVPRKDGPSDEPILR